MPCKEERYKYMLSKIMNVIEESSKRGKPSGYEESGRRSEKDNVLDWLDVKCKY